MHSQWTESQAQAWFKQHGWACGFNYLPRSAVNWTEMWQADTFDAAVIDQELGWAGRMITAITPCAPTCRLSSGKRIATACWRASTPS